MKLYALHDKKAKSFSSFFVDRNDTVASRNFAAAVMQEGSLYAKYPEDFELVSLCDVSQDYAGQFEESEPISLSAGTLAVVITAAQVLAAQPKSDKQIPLALEA